MQLTNDIGNSTLYPESDNYYMGDNIPGKPRATLFWFGGFPFIANNVVLLGKNGRALR